MRNWRIGRPVANMLGVMGISSSLMFVSPSGRLFTNDMSRFVVGIIVYGIHAFSQKSLKLPVSGLEIQRIITIKAIWRGAAAYQLGNTSSRTITEVKQR